MEQRVVQMAIGFTTEGTSMNHPPEIDTTAQTQPNSTSCTYDPDLSRIPFMNNHVTNTNAPTTTPTVVNNNNEGNPVIVSKTTDEEKSGE